MATWRVLLIGVASVLVGGWLVLDGTRFLLGSGYLRVDGQLGPWTVPVRAVGLQPESTTVAALLLGLGLALLAAFAVFLTGKTVGAWLLIVAAALVSWYLPFGTVGAALIIGLTAWELARA